ncbi:AAA family ATPase [Flavobacterium macacae]|uniref:ATPase AAA-type core domain-containing protein n=1 Tax=Flavobacterium macacae TaxID=2488993 RepID=A0A3P3W6E8_9FLAO|nr:ATP-binding protein [Flavobacterium macacae]RRJ90731.1 hypothetical protein EG849_09650 [Flavobacterium macacae]
MQIHYIWVKNSGHLRNAGINLSSRFVIEMRESSDPNAATRDLVIIHNKDYIPDFFKKHNVENVTAIIGKNGAGKSSILKYIKSNMPRGLEANVQDDLFAYSIFKDGKEQFRIIEPQSYPCNLKDETGLFEKETYGELVGMDGFRFTGDLSRADYIYYNYFLEYGADSTNWQGLRDISTTGLMAAERRRILEDNRDIESRAQVLLQSSDLENLELSEVAKAIQFFNSGESANLPFNKPEELFIGINSTSALFFTSTSDKDSLVGTILEALENKISKRKPKDAILSTMDDLCYAMLVNYLLDERKYSSSNPYNHPLNDPDNYDSVTEYVLEYFATMQEAKVEHDGRVADITRLQELSRTVPEFIRFIEDLLERNILLPVGQHSKYLKLPLNADTEFEFERLRKGYMEVKGISTFFDFRWRSLSAGEQSYLSMMARFYHIKNHDYTTLNKHLVILIDEGDAGFHPEWQRRFFNITLNYLSALFEGHSLQLIFTANTPFLSSDLPKSHILFIEKMENNQIIFHGMDNNREETFGANIHTLFSDSFYMDGILIGDFAKNRLNSIIKYLGNEEITLPDENYKRTIDLVGEPVLRKKLQDMWFEKFGLDEELHMLEKRIQEIRDIKAKGKQL